MKLNSLHYFSILAQEEHYAVAAARLGISQPSLSSAIHKMENELGVKLFEKDGRNIRLTEKGRYYQLKVDAALKELHAANAALLNSHTDAPVTIRFGFVSGTLQGIVAKQIARYCKNNDRVRFRTYEGSSKELMDLIRREKLDMAIVDSFDRDRNLHFRKLREQGFYAALPNNHPLAKREILDPKELAHLPQIVTYYDVDNSFSEWASGNPENANIICSANTARSAVELAAEGLGVALIPEESVYPKEDITYVRLKNWHHALYMCSLYNKWLEPAVWEFVERVTQAVREGNTTQTLM